MGRRGPKPKPTALQELHGTVNVTRARARAKEPVPTETSLPAPAHLTPEQKADWEFAVKNAPAGVIFACDKGALEIYVIAADHHRIANLMQQKIDADSELKLIITTSVTVDRNGKKTGGGNFVQSPYIGIMSSAGQRMLRAAAELGFTPAARPRLQSGNFDPTMMPAGQAGTRKPENSEKTEQGLDALMARRARLN